MKLFMAGLMVAMLCGFSGCSTIKTQEQAIELACAGAIPTRDLVTLAVQEQHLSVEAGQQAVEYGKEINTVCGQDSSDLTETEYGEFLIAYERLRALAKEIQQ